MPIEIKELHIKINVADAGTTTRPTGEVSQKKKEKIIAECLEQMMQIDRRKTER
ncbi:MAG: DUF5908 family protein [Leeuwenhoekiella sp.]